MNRKKLIIIYSILCVLVLIGLGGYVVFVKFIDNKDKNTIKHDFTFEKLKNNDERFYNSYESLLDFTYSSNRGNGISSFSSSELINAISVKLLDNDFVVSKVKDKNTGNFYYYLGLDTINKYLVELFGGNASIGNIEECVGVYTINSTLGNTLNIISFDSEKNSFVCTIGYLNARKIINYDNLRKIVNVELEDEYITVYEKAIYVKEDRDYIKIYSDYLMTSLIETIPADEDVDINKYLDNAAEIIQLYRLDYKTNKYYFNSSYIHE